ncbi:MAG: hypothetical protein K0R92_540 [Lachnospiraceae bacterium]|jgi:hypothetical protein|nr:hypothetical protein [Lachnospiraceae bacterium]
MTVKEFAELFGMTVTELSEFSGYTRQALYNIIEGNAIVNSRRYNALLLHLEDYAWKQSCEKSGAIMKEYETRIAAIKELKNVKRNYNPVEADDYDFKRCMI